MPLGGLLISGGVALAGQGMQAYGAKKQGKAAQDAFDEAQSKSQAFLDTRYDAIKTLEEMSQKLRSGDPLTDEQKAWFESRRQSMWDGITQARNEAVKNIMATGAASGFLRGGRTQAQVRQANVEMARALSNASVEQNRMEVELQQERQRRADAMLVGIMGSQVPQFQARPVGTPMESLIGSGLSGLGAAGVSAFGGAYAQGLANPTPQRLPQGSSKLAPGMYPSRADALASLPMGPPSPAPVSQSPAPSWNPYGPQPSQGYF